MKFEIEIKLSLPANLGKIRRVLRDAGFTIDKRRVLEVNMLFDTPDQCLRTQSKILRVRRAGPSQVLTYKGASTPGRHKQREELEVEISTPHGLEEILGNVGFRPSFRYDKYRTEYSKPRSAGKIMLDETPIGNFLEIEGKPKWIDDTAKRLGFSTSDYITASYGSLYFTYCNERGIEPQNMVFSKVRETPRVTRKK